jgi:hypothetical protein
VRRGSLVSMEEARDALNQETGKKIGAKTIRGCSITLGASCEEIEKHERGRNSGASKFGY